MIQQLIVIKRLKGIILYTVMESFKGNKLGFYPLIYKSKSPAASKAAEIWIRRKDICLSLGYKYYKQVIQKNVCKENKKKPNCQDHRYLCYFLNKDGVYKLISKKKQLLKWIENKIYKNYKQTIVRIYKKDYEALNKFKPNLYKKYQKKKDKYEKAKKDAIKEALEDAEINYYGLEDYLKKR